MIVVAFHAAKIKLLPAAFNGKHGKASIVAR
jgi:hypothetical protein